MIFKVFWLMFFITLPGFAQHGDVREDDVTRPEDLEQRVHVLGSNPDAPVENPQVNPQVDPQNPDLAPTNANIAPSDDEAMIDNLEAERKKSVEAALMLDKAKNNLTNAAFNAPEELKKLGYETITATALMDEKVVKVVKKMMEQSTLKQATDEEVRKLILDKAKGSLMENYLKNHPKVTDTFVEILKDEKAMSSMVGIFLRRNDLKLYGLFWLGLMILAWLFKKIVFKKDWPRGKHIGLSLLVSFCVTVTSLTIFYNMFSNEISPMAKIIVKNWRKRNL